MTRRMMSQPGPLRTRRIPRLLSARRRRRGFTIVEVLVGVAIIGVLLSISGMALRHLSESAVLAQARNAVLTYAQFARSYAVTHQNESMLVINPTNGRFEVWYLNPPTHGGAWDPLSSGDATEPEKTDGYMYANILDSAARLPLDSDDQPAAMVVPIDYEQRPAPAADPNGRYLDNLTWAALCFDENGRLVIRSRRIATQPYFFSDGSMNPNANRLADGSPNLSLMPLVDVDDTPITSSFGFVISDASRVWAALGTSGLTPARLVDDWLMLTRPAERYAGFAATVIFNRFSGEPLVRDW